MAPILEQSDYLKLLLETPRPNEDKILAFYEHRLGAICKAPRLMLLPLDDHLAHRGDGIFETLVYRHGRIYELDAHLSRMQASATGIYLEPPCAWAKIRELIIEVAKASGTKDGLLRILMGRGAGGFGIDPFEPPISSLYIVAYHFSEHSEDWYNKGLSGFKTSIPAKQGYLAKIKNANYLPNVLMTREAKIKGYDIPFCYDETGYLAESAIANLCLVDKTGTLIIPKFSHALAGTTILKLLQLIEKDNNKIPHKFKQVSEAEVREAQELLVLGTGIGCASVTSYEGQQIADGKPGKTAAYLRKLLQADLKNGVLIK
nr:aminotransferase class IV [Desulfovibrio litoralis]